MIKPLREELLETWRAGFTDPLCHDALRVWWWFRAWPGLLLEAAYAVIALTLWVVVVGLPLGVLERLGVLHPILAWLGWLS